MTFKNTKLLDIHASDSALLFDASAKFNYDACGNGNDSYYAWTVVESPTGDDQGWGYLTDGEAKLINDFTLAEGAEIGDTVIINHWW